MKLGYEQVRHIAWLTRLGLSEEDVGRYGLQLSHILRNFDILQQLDTADAPPASHTIAQRDLLREDVVADSFPQQEVLSGAPRREENCFKVQAILE
jgi:aspartyl-tRNA(Asn)/glutamyl-tRNA(Gln) amidotransferase subunit C